MYANICVGRRRKHKRIDEENDDIPEGYTKKFDVLLYDQQERKKISI